MDQRSRLSCFATLVELDDLIKIARIIQMIIQAGVRTSFYARCIGTKLIGSFRVISSDCEQLEGQDQVKGNKCENSVYG